MESKEALRRIYNDAISLNEIEEDVEEIKKDYEIIQQDLERLENLSIEIDELLDSKLELVIKNKQQDIFITELIKYKKALDILKDKIELPLEDDFDVFNKDDIHLYRLRIKALVNEEEYNLLKEWLNE